MAMKGNSFMHRVAELIVKLRWVFIILFVAAIVFSAFSVQWIQIENDIKAICRTALKPSRVSR